MENRFEVTFLGTGGSCSYNNGGREKYGSNTPCVAVKAGEETLIFDAGSGICGFGNLKEYENNHMRVFISHQHIDHIVGLLFFSPLFDEKKKIDLYGAGNDKNSFRGIMDGFLSFPLHPVGFESFRAKCDFITIKGGDSIVLSERVSVSTINLPHPGGALGYRVEYGGKSLCYCTDVELSVTEDTLKLIKFMQGANLLIIDAFFDDGHVIPGWGHSSWKEAAEFACLAKAEKLALFHYNYSLFDADINAIEQKAKSVFPNTFAPTDGMRVLL